MKKILVLVLAVLSVAALIPSVVSAGVSEAGVLFLRIAPGSRAAGLGEAYVAIADDATATHWNPAGLGTHPLSPSWMNAPLPSAHRPLKAIAALRTGKGSDYAAFDIWAISSAGVIRYNNKKWESGETFTTRSDDTIEKRARAYYNMTDDAALEEIIDGVARANSKATFEEVQELRKQIIGLVPDSYKDAANLRSGLDSLVTSYHLCLIKWSNYESASNKIQEGLADSILTTDELERINFAIMNVLGRFIPEEIVMPYSAILRDEPTSIASTGDWLLIGTANGLYKTNGVTWQRFTVDDGLPSSNITSLNRVGMSIIVGTENGMMVFSGLELASIFSSDQAPKGKVQSVGGTSTEDFYAVVDGTVHHYDGSSWQSGFQYTTVLEDSPDSIADRFAFSGSAEERASFMNRLRELNASVSSSWTADGFNFEPGTSIQLPYAGPITSEVTATHVDLYGNLWIGTSEGAFRFDGQTWHGVSESNPASQGVVAIVGIDDKVYVGTNAGLVEFVDGAWHRSEVGGLANAPVGDVFTLDDEIWFAGLDKVTTRGKGRTEFSLMHVNWLPELASDLYYEFFSVVKSTETWGTFGGSVTFLSYGELVRTGQTGLVEGTWSAFEVALTGSYGTGLTDDLAGGISAKVIYSHLSEQGAASERGTGTATSFAVDLGLLYKPMPRLSIGMAITNLGPNISYIDAAQSDPLPRNLAIGFAYKLMRSEYNQLLITMEMNKMLVGLGDGFGAEMKELVLNGGIEFTYANLFAVRGGYIYDQEGQIKTATVGVGVTPFDWIKFDFAYIPTDDAIALANTLRISLSILP